jgi:hypothetical protein
MYIWSKEYDLGYSWSRYSLIRYYIVYFVFYFTRRKIIFFLLCNEKESRRAAHNPFADFCRLPLRATLITRRIYKYTKNYKVNDLDNDGYEH